MRKILKYEKSIYILLNSVHINETTTVTIIIATHTNTSYFFSHPLSIYDIWNN